MSERINLDVGLTSSRKFACRISDKGELKPAEPGRWIAWLTENKGRSVEVAVSRPKRSSRANAYWWAVVVPLVAEILTREAKLDLPLSNEAVHYRLVAVFGPAQKTPLGRVGIRSSEMDSAQFSELVNQTRAWLLHKYGVICPTPEDYWEAA